MTSRDQLITKAQEEGDINAFHQLFSEFEDQLRAFLYRLTTNKTDADDLVHDTFIRAFDNIKKFRRQSSLKTWTFTIGTNLAYDRLKNNKRWREDSMVHAKRMAHNHSALARIVGEARRNSTHNQFVIQEHIDYCFTCTTKMLPLDQQIALVLKDVYAFKLNEIAEILSLGVGKIKHLVRDARQTMIRVFDTTCALVNKQGVCNQCSELNGMFNPQQKTQEELMKIKMVKAGLKKSPEELLEMRVNLIKKIDPLHAQGSDLHEAFLEVVEKSQTLVH